MEFKGKSVLVTGAGGFIGSHLVEALVSEGCRIRAFVHYNSFNRWGWLDTLSPEVMENVDVFTGDIADGNGVRTAMKDCEIVFHLAALIGIPFSYHSPASYVQTNMIGTLNVLQAARDLEVERTLVTSTSEVYGTALYAPINEKHPRQGQSPYSATKIAADALAESFWKSFELPVTIVRPFNTFGPRQSARAVIPTIITQLLNKLPEIRLGSLHPTRDFVYVKDTARGFIELARSEETLGREVNIATCQEVSIGQLAEKLVERLAPDTRIVAEDQRVRPSKSEVERLLGDNELITRLTRWKPAYTFEDGLDETIVWFSKGENLKQYKAGIYNV